MGDNWSPITDHRSPIVSISHTIRKIEGIKYLFFFFLFRIACRLLYTTSRYNTVHCAANNWNAGCWLWWKHERNSETKRESKCMMINVRKILINMNEWMNIEYPIGIQAQGTMNFISCFGIFKWSLVPVIEPTVANCSRLPWFIYKHLNYNGNIWK